MPICRLRFGTPEPFVPTRFAPPPKIALSEEAPDVAKTIRFSVSERGTRLTMPIRAQAGVYGFGLQLKGFQHRGTKKRLCVNADPRSNSGDSHAPAPFFATTEGFGLYVDTARTATVYCGLKRRPPAGGEAAQGGRHGFTTDLDELYAVRVDDAERDLVVEIPVAKGVDLYVITGESILDIVSQYNLLSGGGCLPPLWGLGNFYRCGLKFDAPKVLAMARRFRELDIPCDVIGLEPGWQTTAYSSSYVWDPVRFPDPAATLAELKRLGFHVNLWQHAFTHPSSPLYPGLLPYSGDTLVWNGLVPDFATEEARRLFADYQKQTLVDIGVDGVKLDECDGSDFTGSWSFPDCASFPSGLDGEQYHALFGTLYAQTALRALEGRPTLSEIRNLGALAASYPFVLYSDLYEHRDFVTGVVNAGFSGLLWTPEVRDASSARDLVRRVQCVVFSAHSLVNAWYLEEMPWVALQCTGEIRRLLRIRMQLIPYLYAAFADYRDTGKPPVRALVCDYQDQPESWDVDDEYLLGDSLLVAPILAPAKPDDPSEEREVWLPEGEWHDFFTGAGYAGGKHRVKTGDIPVFVKGGTLLPLARPVPYVGPDTRLEIELRAYGDCSKAACRLVDDTPEGTVHTVTAATRHLDSPRYTLA
ncbi:MAG: TIM-barrel domain-containing protein [Kiritimatiellia bacterium]|jgi:alpha-glucosidase (family GH31 glycosyl hydrolase)